MSFQSYKPFKRKKSFPKFAIVFLLGMSFVLFFSNAFTIVTGIENASQYIKQIILTSDGSFKGTTGIIIDGNTSGGRMGSDLYCTLDFSKCVTIKSLISTGDLGSLGIIKTGDLATFKTTEIDPLITNLSGKIATISGSLSTYAKTTDLDGYTRTSQFDTLSGIVATTRSDLSLLSGSVSSVYGKITDINANFNRLIDNLSGAGYTGFIEGISRL